MPSREFTGRSTIVSRPGAPPSGSMATGICQIAS